MSQRARAEGEEMTNVKYHGVLLGFGQIWSYVGLKVQDDHSRPNVINLFLDFKKCTNKWENILLYRTSGVIQIIPSLGGCADRLRF